MNAAGDGVPPSRPESSAKPVLYNGVAMPAQSRMEAMASRLAGPSDRGDLVQGAYLRIMRGIGTVDKGRDLASFAFIVMLNIKRDSARREKAWFGEDRSVPLNLAQPGLPALDAMVAEEDGAAVRSAVARLPRYQQTVLSLAASGMSYRDMSRRMGVPVGTVKSRLGRAREMARTVLLFAARRAL